MKLCAQHCEYVTCDLLMCINVNKHQYSTTYLIKRDRNFGQATCIGSILSVFLLLAHGNGDLSTSSVGDADGAGRHGGWARDAVQVVGHDCKKRRRYVLCGGGKKRREDSGSRRGGPLVASCLPEQRGRRECSTAMTLLGLTDCKGYSSTALQLAAK